VGGPGHNDDGNMHKVRLSSKPGEDLVTVGARHFYIEDDDIGARVILVREVIDTILAISYNGNRFVAGLTDRALDEEDIIAGVIRY